MNHRHDLFKWRRTELGWSLGEVQRRLPRKAKLAKGTILAAEKAGANPQAGTLKILARCYGIEPSFSMNFNLPKDQFHSALVSGEMQQGVR
jgi:transcriptional regulator with XRE-family HTH domain